MKTSLTSRFIPSSVLFTFALLMTATLPSARAALLAYEGFDYATSTPLNGLTGGSGWLTPWSAPAAAVTAAGLGYTDTSGNVLVLGIDHKAGANDDAYLFLNPPPAPSPSPTRRPPTACSASTA